MPIESRLGNSLVDHLNAEVVLGTVSNVDEAVTWLSYTYYYVRLMRNPAHYGVALHEKQLDVTMHAWRRQLVMTAANTLDDAHLMRYNKSTEIFGVTDLGRTASHYYITHKTMAMFEKALLQDATDADVFQLISEAEEFENIKVIMIWLS